MENAPLLNRILSVQNFIAYDCQGQFPLASEHWKMTSVITREKSIFFLMLVKSQVINCQPIKTQPRGKELFRVLIAPEIPDRKLYIRLYLR